MVAYHFRVIGEDGKPTGWVGLVCAPSMKYLKDAIDEFVEADSVEIMPAVYGGFCRYDHGEETETSDMTPFSDDKGWKKPPWVQVSPKQKKLDAMTIQECLEYRHPACRTKVYIAGRLVE